MIDPNLSLTDQEPPLTEAEKKDVVEHAAERLRHSRNRFLIWAVALLACYGFIYPSLNSNAVHSRWFFLSKYLIWVALGVFLLCVNYGAATWMAWKWLRDLKHDEDPRARWD